MVFDRGKVGDTWRHRWDSFCLVTPNWTCQLSGFPYDGDEPDNFMKRDQILAYIDRFAKSFGPPYRAGVEVRRLTSLRDGERFLLDTSEDIFSADNVIIATGTFSTRTFPSGEVTSPTTSYNSIPGTTEILNGYRKARSLW